ncbi:hypothetical protein FOA52_002728 [Chlamydomonas sp. UWO 241]|nr:hypothetical protein FOA52_002728 [Chlamydomonas sp. UWO 241]
MGPTASTHMCRGAVLAVAAWIAFDGSRADAVVQGAWDSTLASKWVQWDTFEPSLVVIVFLLSLWFFWALDVPLHERSAPWRAGICANPDMRAWRWEGGKRILHETAFYVVPLVVLDVLFPRRVLPDAAPGAARLVIEVVASLLLYDLLFTAGHVLCHSTPWLYRTTHSKHHRATTVRACETVCLTLWEEGLDVACSVAALNLVRAHPMSRAVYNVVIVYLLVELHSGYEFPWMLQDVVPCGLMAGSRKHALHHRYGNVCYQKFFTYIDAAMGTLSKDKSATAKALAAPAEPQLVQQGKGGRKRFLSPPS